MNRGQTGGWVEAVARLNLPGQAAQAHGSLQRVAAWTDVRGCSAQLQLPPCVRWTLISSLGLSGDAGIQEPPHHPLQDIIT